MKLKLLSDMMIFVKVVEQQNFTSAAKLLNLSKSAVSKHISHLEESLNVQLLQRSTRQLTPTEAGRALYERCAQISSDIEEAERAVTHTQDIPHGTLRITSPASFGHLHLAPALVDFLQIHPELDIQILIGNYYENLIENGLDLAIRMGELKDSNMIARRITTRRMRVCASPGYIEKHGRPEHPHDLKNHNCLLYRDSPTGKEWHFVKNNKEEIRVAVKGNMLSNSRQALEHAAINGLGLAWLPGYMMTRDIKEGKLVTLLEPYCPPNIDIHAVYPYTRYLAPKVRLFIDFLVERFQDESYWR